MYDTTLKDIIKFHGKDSVKIIKGRTYEHKTHDMFKKYMEIFISEKVLQGEYKKNKDPKYNQAMEEVSKLFLNCITGKVGQLNYMSKSILSTNDEIKEKVQEKLNTVTGELKESMFKSEIKVECDITEDYKIYQLKKKDEYKVTNESKPSQISGQIYAHARSNLYNTFIAYYDTCYCDTDSAFFPEHQYAYFKKDNHIKLGLDENYNPKYPLVIGCVEEEINGNTCKSEDKHKMDTIFVVKKGYVMGLHLSDDEKIKYDNELKEINSKEISVRNELYEKYEKKLYPKLRMKGVKGSDKYIDEETYFATIENNENCASYEETYDISDDDYQYYISLNKHKVELYSKYINMSYALKSWRNMEFFNRLFKGETLYCLSSRINKTEDSRGLTLRADSIIKKIRGYRYI
jgi:hypothetical protein